MNSDENKDLVNEVKQRFNIVSPYLSERAKRIWAASEAITIGWGGDSIVYRATSISRARIARGRKEIQEKEINIDTEYIRQKGGGRKKLITQNIQLLKDINEMIDPYTRGDPESPLRWTCKSTYKICEALKRNGHEITQRTVCTILKNLGYSLQSNRKSLEGKQHIDRDAQFLHIYNFVKKFQKKNQPVISVDAKKKENIGNYSNHGKEWRKKSEPELVNTYDFPDKLKGKACPYGIYDVANNEGWMSVGISKDTAEFAVESIRRWWMKMGKLHYPFATQLLITADGGGSNSYRAKLWKREIQNLSNEIGLEIQICHFPPGTSKWNKIEHQMFSFVSKNWRGRPLDSLATIVNLISNTKTNEGLHIKVEVDEKIYEKGIVVSDNEINSLNIKRDEFHGEWNYSISPCGRKKL